MKMPLTETQITPIALDLIEAEKVIQKHLLHLQQHYSKRTNFIRELEASRRGLHKANAALFELAEIY